MAEITIKNTPTTIDMSQSAIDQGWDVSQGIARHTGACFGGYITAPFEVQAGLDYTIQFLVTEYTSGNVYVIVNGQNGTTRTAIGDYTQTFTIPENATDLSVKFYADGIVGISLVKSFPVLDENNSVTLGFNEKDNKWVTYYSFTFENSLKYMNNNFIFNSGRLYKQNSNEVRNNFCGVQYDSQITFYVNINPTEIKNFVSMRQKSNKVWSAPEIEVRPREGKPNGQRSRLKKGRFKRLQGDFFADFLKDQSDPRFLSELEALMKGADLQGSVLKITIINSDIYEVRLMSIDVTTSPSNYTY